MFMGKCHKSPMLAESVYYAINAQLSALKMSV